MLSPLDIQSKVFQKSLPGYNRAEVDEFMQIILTDYETLYRENIGLKDRLNVLSEGINNYKAIEDTMHKTLIVAQSTAEEIKQNAQEKAKNIIEEANLKAREIIDKAQAELNRITSDYELQKKNMEIYKSKTIASLTAQIKALESDDNNN